jgi:hypothetical protein
MWHLKYKQPSKYHNRTNDYGGEIYHSIKEAGYAAELDLRVKAHDIRSWERQIRIPLDVRGYHICNYIIDFVVTHNDGIKEYVEVKGFETDIWRLKWKLFCALYGKKKNVILTVQK